MPFVRLEQIAALLYYHCKHIARRIVIMCLPRYFRALLLLL